MTRFLSAYRQLQPSEREFVDAFVTRVEKTALKEHVHLEEVLNRPLPARMTDHERMMIERPLVLSAISDRVRELAESAELNIYKTQKEIAAIAYSNIGDYFDIGQDGNPWLDMSRCTHEQLSAVKSIKTTHDGKTGTIRHEIVLHDKLAALRMVAEFQGLLDGDTSKWAASPIKEINIPVNTPTEQIAERYSRMING